MGVLDRVRSVVTFGRKETLIPGMDVGWQPWYATAAARAGTPAAANPRQLATLLGTYGGTDDSVTWVYACTSLIMGEMSMYPYEILNQKEKLVPKDRVPIDLKDLLEEPNDQMAYGDMVEYVAMDLELAGNSYWLKDEQNTMGQPLVLQRLRPEKIQIAVTNRGTIAGYLYKVGEQAKPIPYSAEEIVQYKRANPLNEYYGMGTVEAIQRALGADLAQTDHVVGFFSNGARISGVLTTTTLSEIQFERFKQQFYEEYSGDQNAHKILIAEEGTSFTPITQAPGGTGVVDLRKMTKDEILSGFGVHEFLLGGAGQGGVFKMEEAQHILSRRMTPKARKISERMTRDVVSRWGYKYRINVAYAEPKSARVARAQKMLAGGASINESRHEMDLPPIMEPWANLPVIPQGYAPYGLMLSGGTPVLPGSSQLPSAQPPNAVNGQQPLGANGQPPKALPMGIAFPDGFEKFGATSSNEMSQWELHEFLDNHARAVTDAIATFEAMFKNTLVSQRAAVTHKMASFVDRHVARKFGDKRQLQTRDDLTVEAVWDKECVELFDDDYKEAVTKVAEQALATQGIQYVPGSPFEREIMTRMNRHVKALNDQTEALLNAIICEGKRRQYSMRQITDGFPGESFDGVMGMFDKLVVEKADEYAARHGTWIHNLATVLGYMANGVETVEVFDGAGAEACIDANGEVWTVEQALTMPIGHGRCVRAFAPVNDVVR